jgi:hypothetical protein
MSQIPIVRKSLNLFEFENVFDLDLNLDFKFKSAAKIFQKHFHFLMAAQNRFRPVFPSSPICYSRLLFIFPALPAHLGMWPTRPTLAQTTPCLSPTSGRTQPAADG